MSQLIEKISSNLLVVTTLCYVAGIAVAPHLSPLYTESSSLHIVLYASCGLLSAIALISWQRYVSKKFLTPLALLALLVGMLHTWQQLQLPEDNQHIYYKAKKPREAVLHARMMSMAAFDGRTSKILVESTKIKFTRNQQFQPVKGKVLLRLQGVWPDAIQPGDSLFVRLTLKRPDSYCSPGAFDYTRYLARQDIWVTGVVRAPVFLAASSIKESLFNKIRYFPEKLRSGIYHKINCTLSPRHAAIYGALLLGERTAIDYDILESFKASGTFHILAISGIHMGLIGSLLFAIIYWLLKRSTYLMLHFTVKKWAAMLSIPFLFFYALLAGMNTPVMRALLMGMVLIFAICSDRRKSSAPLLCFSALLILLFQPLQLFTVSFQLSFTAVIGILFCVPALKNMLSIHKASGSKRQRQKSFKNTISYLRNWVLAGLLVSTVATMATLPISLFAFNRFSTVGPLANLIVEPALCLLTLSLGVCSLPLLFTIPQAANLLLQTGTVGIDLALQCAQFFAQVPYSSLWRPSPSLLIIALYYAALLLVMSNWKKNRAPILTAIPLLIVIAIMVLPVTGKPHNRQSVQISFLDVAQGSSTLLEFPDNLSILVDGGGAYYGKDSVGERVIAPYLWHRSISKLDGLIITHPDADHYNGLEFIIRRFHPTRIWVRDTLDHDAGYIRLLALAQKVHSDLYSSEKGNILGRDKMHVRCMYNFGSKKNKYEAKSSNSGLIVKACADEFCVLLPGDVEQEDEQYLATVNGKLAAQVLLAAHHGSKTSNSEMFLQAVSPNTIVVSASKTKKKYYPAQRLIEACKKRGIDLISTAELGTIILRVDENSYFFEHMQRRFSNPLLGYEKIQSKARPR